MLDIVILYRWIIFILCINIPGDAYITEFQFTFITIIELVTDVMIAVRGIIFCTWINSDLMLFVFDNYSTREVYSSTTLASKHPSHRRTICVSMVYTVRLALDVSTIMSWQITHYIHRTLWYLHLHLPCSQWKTRHAQTSFMASFGIVFCWVYTSLILCSAHCLSHCRPSKEIPIPLWSYHHASLLFSVCFGCCLHKPETVDFVYEIACW